MEVALKLAVLVLAVTTLALCDDDKDTAEMKIETTHQVECERKSKKHDLVSMHYTGYLLDGSQFDSTSERNQPFQFQLGIGQVIRGWEQGLLDMCPGEKRKLTIPPSHAYGEVGAGDKIPPGSTLIFDVEMLEAKEGPVPPNVFKQIDTDKDQILTEAEISAYLVNQAKEHGDTVDPKSEEHLTVVRTIFEHEDRDHDKFISFDEFSGPKHDEL